MGAQVQAPVPFQAAQVQAPVQFQAALQPIVQRQVPAIQTVEVPQVQYVDRHVDVPMVQHVTKTVQAAPEYTTMMPQQGFVTMPQPIQALAQPAVVGAGWAEVDPARKP